MRNLSRMCIDLYPLCSLTSSPSLQTASSACQMACLAPLLTTISSGLYSNPFSSFSF